MSTEAEKVVKLKKAKQNEKKEEQKKELTPEEKAYLEQRDVFINDFCNKSTPVGRAIMLFDMTSALNKLIREVEALKKCSTSKEDSRIIKVK